MNNKTKRVSINQFEKAIEKENIIEVQLEGATDVAFNIQKTLPLSEVMSFVTEVVESCVDGANGEYIPEAYDFAIRVGVLNYYSNLKLPASIEKQYTLAYETSAFDQILAHINTNQFRAIVDAIDKKIAYMTNIMLSAISSKVNEIIDTFNNMTQSNEDVLNNIDPKIISEIASRINLQNQNDINANGHVQYDTSEHQDTVIVEK